MAGEKISGAQKWSGFPLFNPGHWALGMQKLSLLRLHNCAWLCRTNAPGVVPAVGAAPCGRPPSMNHDARRARPPGRAAHAIP